MILKILRYVGILLIALAIISLIASLKFPLAQSFRVVFGAAFVLFIPGFIWSYVFFSKKSHLNLPFTSGGNNRILENPLDLIERIILSFALSMAMGPLLIFFLNKVGMEINFINSFVEILLLIIVGLVIILLHDRKISRH
jgi:uncharacterized membrane protein